MFGISIHALRGEGDARPHKKQLRSVYFNPRPPWGGRLAETLVSLGLSKISIHALRGEGDRGGLLIFTSKTISIHALRGEGD